MRPALALLLGTMALAACGDAGAPMKPFEDMSGAEHLACAANISAYSHFKAQGKIAPDPQFDRAGLEGMMWHLNAYAVPQNLSEQEAFKTLDGLKDELLAKGDPATVEQVARDCAANVPEQ